MKRIFLLSILLLLVPKVCYGVDISAKSACLITADTHEVVYEKYSDMKLPMASTTKMMTALVAAESDKWDEVATVSLNAQNQIGSKIYLKENDRMSLSNLVSGMLLNSGNDAAVAVAEHVSGDVAAFAQRMNVYANKIGASNTSFDNPSGLDDDNHYSTAYDLALIASEVIKSEKLLPIIKSKELKITNMDGEVTYLRNHNKLLWSYEGMLGVKTGYTKKAGRCLVTAAERDGVTLIAVTLSAPDDWDDHKKLLDYGFEVCKSNLIIKKGEKLDKIVIDKNTVNLVSKEPVILCDVVGKKEKREVVVKRLSEAKGPINAGDKLGYAEVIQNGNVAAKVDLVADRDVTEEEKAFFSKIKDWLSNLI